MQRMIIVHDVNESDLYALHAIPPSFPSVITRPQRKTYFSDVIVASATTVTTTTGMATTTTATATTTTTTATATTTAATPGQCIDATA